MPITEGPPNDPPPFRLSDPSTPITSPAVAREWLLRARKYGISQHVSRYVLEALDVETAVEMIYDGTLVRMYAQILTRDVRAYDVTADAQVPATWWDHYKRTLWGSVVDRPGWQAASERRLFRALRLDRVRWRAATATLHVEEFLAFPDADPALIRSLGGGVEKRVVTGPRWEPFLPPFRAAPEGTTDDD